MASPAERPWMVSPAERPWMVSPAERPWMVSPAERPWMVSPAERPWMVSPAERPWMVSPAERLWMGLAQQNLLGWPGDGSFRGWLCGRNLRGWSCERGSRGAWARAAFAFGESGLGTWRLLLLAALLLLGVPRCFAHPMGNFSINHYAGIRLERDAVQVLYIIDQAEIPTFQALSDAGIAVAPLPDPKDASVRPLLAGFAAAWSRGLLLQVNGQTVVLHPVAQTLLFPPGAGGLATMKIAVVYRGKVQSAADGMYSLRYRDGNFAGHAGWKEIVVAAGSGVELSGGNAFRQDRSDQLSNYPTDLLNSPPQDLTAELRYTAVAAAVAPSSAAATPFPAAATPFQPATPHPAGTKATAPRDAMGAATKAAVGATTNAAVGAAANAAMGAATTNVARGAGAPNTPAVPAKAQAAGTAAHSSAQVPAAATPPAVVQSEQAPPYTEAGGTDGRAPEIHLQANRQATPRSRFTELMANRELGAVVSADRRAARCRSWSGARAGTRAWENDRGRLPGGFTRTCTPCRGPGSAGHGGAHCRRVPAGHGGAVRVAPHCAGADLPVAQHCLRAGDCGVGGLPVSCVPGR